MGGVRYLAAPHSVGPDDDDFTFTVPGELVIVPVDPCENRQCGCARSFRGLGSDLASTTATVTVTDLSMDAITTLAVDAHTRTGEAHIPEPVLRQAVAATADLAAPWPAGTVVRCPDHSTSDGQHEPD